MRYYWLGQFPLAQRSIMEDQWFGNDEDCEMLEITRGDLIEDYLNDALPGIERTLFTENFLSVNAEEIAVTAAYLELGRRETSQLPLKTEFFPSLIAGWFSFNRAWQTGLVLLVFGAALVWLVKLNNSGAISTTSPDRSETANWDTPLEIDSANASRDLNALSSSGTEDHINAANASGKAIADNRKFTRAATKHSPRTSSSDQPSVAGISAPVYFLTVLRGSDSVQNLKTGNNQTKFSLSLPMPGLEKPYRNYALHIFNANGNLILKRQLRNISNKKTGSPVLIKNIEQKKLGSIHSFYVVLNGDNDPSKPEELFRSGYFTFK